MKNSSKKIVTVSSIAPRDEEDPIAGFMRGVLQELSEDPEREGLKKTPDRVAKALRFLTQGYDQDVMEVLNGALFAEDHQEMVVLKDIVIYSLCEHHLLPFFGKCHVAYVPNKKIVGLSKIARLVDVFARRLQVQERMTNEIANVIMQVLDPLGVAVVIEAEHLCMQMRGVQKRGSVMITSAMLGAFRNRQETRAEFMKLIRC